MALREAWQYTVLMRICSCLNTMRWNFKGIIQLGLPSMSISTLCVSRLSFPSNSILISSSTRPLSTAILELHVPNP